MLDEITGDWGLAPRTVVADAGYGDATGFRLGLSERGLSYVLAVKSSTSAHPHDAVPERLPYTPGHGRPPVPRYRTPHPELRELAMTAGRSAARYVTWRHGSRKDPRNPTAALRREVGSSHSSRASRASSARSIRPATHREQRGVGLGPDGGDHLVQELRGRAH